MHALVKIPIKDGQMTNKRLLGLMLCVIVGYFLIQLLLYTYSGQGHLIPERHTSFLASKKSIQSFNEVSHQFGVALILLDYNVLVKVTQVAVGNSSSDRHACHFLCEDTIVFGVLSHLWKHDESFLNQMRVRGFSAVYTFEKDVDSLIYLGSVEGLTVYTHYIFQNNVHTVHLVILYERHGKYWWHGPVSSDSQFEGDVHQVVLRTGQLHTFANQAGFYDSVEVIKVTIDGQRLRAPRYPEKFLKQLPHSTFLSCNHSLAALFSAQYGQPDDGDTQAATFHDEVKTILSLAKSALDGLDIRFWLSSGTCLGWHRQCSTIAHSKDVDIGIWIKDYNRHLIPAMQENGLKLKHVFGKENDSYELSFENHGVKLDIFFFYEEEMYMWNGGTQARTGKKFKYIFSKFTLCWTEFLSLKVRVPCETEQYLEANYGRDWFVPIKIWDWKKSPPNVVENGQWLPKEWDQVIQILD